MKKGFGLRYLLNIESDCQWTLGCNLKITFLHFYVCENSNEY